MTDTTNTDASANTDTPTTDSIIDQASATAQEAAKTVADTSASLLGQAKDAIGQAVETTIGAVKEHPVAAAAIGAGVAATVAGAAYGVSKLLEEDEAPAKGTKAKAKA